MIGRLETAHVCSNHRDRSLGHLSAYTWNRVRALNHIIKSEALSQLVGSRPSVR